MLSTRTKRTQPGWDSEIFITITNNSRSLKPYVYPQWAMLPSSADPTRQKYHGIFICIILVSHSCHGSKIYTQQPHCHFRLQMELVCSQFGSAKKRNMHLLYARPYARHNAPGAEGNKKGISIRCYSFTKQTFSFSWDEIIFIKLQ